MKELDIAVEQNGDVRDMVIRGKGPDGQIVTHTIDDIDTGWAR